MHEKNKKLILPMFITFFITMILYSKHISSAVQLAINSITTEFLPQIFPFMFLATFLTELSNGPPHRKHRRTIIYKILGLGGKSGMCLFIGLLCGFPSGAIAASQLYEKSQISKSDAQKLILISNLPSPAFCISFVGAHILQSPITGFLIYLSCVLGSFCACFLAKFPKDSSEVICQHKESQITIAESFINSIVRTTKSFSILSGVYIALSAMLEIPGMIFKKMNLHPKILICILFAFNLVQGCNLLDNFTLDFSAIISTAALSFQGLSIYLQTYPALKKTGLKFSVFLIYRLLITIFSCVFITFFLFFL